MNVEKYFDFILHIISVETRFWTSGSLLTRTPYGAASGTENLQDGSPMDEKASNAGENFRIIR